MAYPIARRSFFPFVSIFAKDVEGMDNIPFNQAVVVAANHLGLLDPVFIGALFVRKTKKKLRFLVDTRRKFWYIMGYVLQHWTNTIPIRPGRENQALNDAVVWLTKGDSVAVFPEGQVNTSPSLLPGRTGAVRMSLLSSKPILPVGIENTDVRLMTIIARRAVNRREGITIRFGEPYQPVGDAADQVTVRRLTDELMRRIAKLSGKIFEL